MPTFALRLEVENSSKFVSRGKRAKEDIWRYCLEPYGMKRLEPGNYQLVTPWRIEDELDKTVNDISHEADMRSCLIEAGA